MASHAQRMATIVTACRHVCKLRALCSMLNYLALALLSHHELFTKVRARCTDQMNRICGWSFIRCGVMSGRGGGYSYLSLAEALDLADLLGRDVQAGLGAELSGTLEADNDRVGDVDIASDIDLDQPEVDGELLDLDVNGGLDLGRERGSDLVRDLDRGLCRQLDGILDNVVGLELDASSIVLGAALGDEGSKAGAQVGRELGLDLDIDFVADGGLDRGAESGRELGAETEIDVDKTAEE